jgi:hypothetical protein
VKKNKGAGFSGLVAIVRGVNAETSAGAGLSDQCRQFILGRLEPRMGIDLLRTWISGLLYGKIF